MNKLRWMKKWLGLLLALGLLLGGLARPVGVMAAGDRYVDPAGSDSGGCQNPVTPCQTIAYAIAQAAGGDTIHLAAGTYPEHGIVVQKALTFLGAGMQADTGSVVDAQNLNRVFDIIAVPVTFSDLRLTHGQPPDLSGQGGNGGTIRSDGPITLTRVTIADSRGYQGGALYLSGAVIAESTFTHNAAEKDAGVFWIGGSLQMTGTQVLSNTASVDSGVGRVLGRAAIQNSQFISNTAQGGNVGVLQVDGSLAMTATQFISNTAAFSTGALYILGDAAIQASQFIRNTAQASRIGALAVEGALRMKDSQFTANTAQGDDGALNVVGDAAIQDSQFLQNSSAGYSGAGTVRGTLALTQTQFLSNTAGIEMGALNAQGDAVITGCQFISNTAVSNIGAVYVYGSLWMTGTQFISNTMAGYGALDVHAQATILDSQFRHNLSNGDGGAVWANSSIWMTGTQFISNTAAGNFGALYSGWDLAIVDGLFQGNKAGGRWGAMNLGGSTSAISGTLFISNTAGSGGGIGELYGASLAITNTRFISNSAGASEGVLKISSAQTQLVNLVFARQERALTVAPGAQVDILHTTLVGPGDGSGVGIEVQYGKVNIKDSLITGFATGVLNVSGPVDSSYNLYYANTVDREGEIYSSHEVEGQDPRFADPAAGDYRLQVGSPALGAGAYDGRAPRDILGLARPDPPAIGAYQTTVWSQDASLRSLALSQGSLSPAFAPGTLDYSVGLGFGVTSLALTPVAGEAHAALHLRVNGGTWYGAFSGQPSLPLDLNVGANLIELRVTAQDGTQQVYTLTVTRAPVRSVYLPAIYREHLPVR